jgi:hypothetical protein
MSEQTPTHARERETVAGVAFSRCWLCLFAIVRGRGLLCNCHRKGRRLALPPSVGRVFFLSSPCLVLSFWRMASPCLSTGSLPLQPSRNYLSEPRHSFNCAREIFLSIRTQSDVTVGFPRRAIRHPRSTEQAVAIWKMTRTVFPPTFAATHGLRDPSSKFLPEECQRAR